MRDGSSIAAPRSTMRATDRGETSSQEEHSLESPPRVRAQHCVHDDREAADREGPVLEFELTLVAKCSDQRVRTLLYQAANVMLTRVDRGDRRHHSGARRTQTPHGGAEASDSLAGLRALSMKATMSARGSRIPNATARPPIWFSKAHAGQPTSCAR